MLKINENVSSKFEEVTGLKLIEVQNTAHSIKLATFDSFSVADELNLKLLACQGVNSEYVKLQSARKTSDGKLVYLFMIKNNKVVKFYPCYVTEQKDKLPIINPSIVSVVPKKADNTRQASHNIAMSIANKVIDDKKAVSREEFDALNSKIDTIMSMLIAEKTVTKKGKK